MHSPTPVRLTVELFTEQTPLELKVSTEKRTGLPEPPPVALRVITLPSAPVFGEIKVICCGVPCTDPALQPPLIGLGNPL